MAIYIDYADKEISGCVTAKEYEDMFEVDSFQFGVGRGISMEVGNASNRESTRPSISEVTLSKSMDLSGNMLLQEALVGSEGKTVIIHFVNTGTDKLEEYLTYTLEECLISSYSVSVGSEGTPNESIALSFTRFETKYTGRDAKNAAGDQPIVAYNLATGEPS